MQILSYRERKPPDDIECQAYKEDEIGKCRKEAKYVIQLNYFSGWSKLEVLLCDRHFSQICDEMAEISL